MTRLQKWGIALGIVFFLTLVYLLAPILTPFIIAAFFAYLGDPLVNRLVKWRLSRTLAVTLVFTFMFLVIILLMALLIPLIQDQIVILINRIPAIVVWIQSVVMPWIQNHVDVNASFNVATLKNTLTTHWAEAGNIFDKIIKTVSHSGVAFVAFIINIVLVPVVTFYLLRDWQILLDKIAEIIPRKMYPTVSALAAECNEVLGAFIRGQLLVMLSLGVIYTIGLNIIGLDLALLIAIIIAVFSIVPYLGTVIGLMAAILATVFQFHDTLHVVYVLGLFIIGHILEGMVLTPLLVGDRIGLHPVAVIFAILAGGQLFGFFGVLLALPVAAVVMVWVRHLYKHYLQSNLYHH